MLHIINKLINLIKSFTITDTEIKIKKLFLPIFTFKVTNITSLVRYSIYLYGIVQLVNSVWDILHKN